MKHVVACNRYEILRFLTFGILQLKLGNLATSIFVPRLLFSSSSSWKEYQLQLKPTILLVKFDADSGLDQP